MQRPAMKSLLQVVAGILAVSYLLQHALNQWADESRRRSGRRHLAEVCLRNLKGIANLTRAYASDHGGAYPPDLQALGPYAKEEPSVFECCVCFNSSGLLPRVAGARTSNAWDLPGTLSYAYVVPGSSNEPRNRILAFCMCYHPGVHVVYLDGRTGVLSPREFSLAVRRIPASQVIYSRATR